MNKTITKIQKLLSLNKSCNEHEAQLAFAKAKALADKHDLDLYSVAIQGGEVEQEPFVQEKIDSVKRLPVIHKYVWPIITNHFKVQVIYNNFYGGRRINFIGRKNDVETAREVYFRLMDIFDWLWKSYKKKHNETNKTKHSYLYGLCVGLDQKLSEAHDKSLNDKVLELPDSIQNGAREQLQLMIVDEKAQLAAAVKTFYKKISHRSTRYGYVDRRDAYQDGVRDGRNVNVDPAQKALC